ncbi:hypothetical protein HX882_27940 [Pseudomonas gingeri]|uniref:Uncharacterized protein n=1 Tax=Pseudomonas gingeri TaxID=117681 RepID=A0A7Y8C5C8_9PSED|nr:hypothetical protein [Pseudomonas gingeri]NWB99709.1 hypothetical protein [Pseudomonas gingeri]
MNVNKSSITVIFNLVIFCLALAGLSAAAQAALLDEGSAGGNNCTPVSVNDAGVEVGACTDSSTHTSVAYIAVTPGSEVDLAPLVSGYACMAGAINHVALASATVVGRCQNASGVWNAVTWQASSPSTTPRLLAPLSGLLGLGADVSTRASGVNLTGIVVGDSISGNGTHTPVYWAAGSTSAVPLAGVRVLLGLLSTDPINCAVSDISDSTPAVVLANCPSGAAGMGKPIALVWTSLSSNAVTVALPAGARYCEVGQVNALGNIVGDCTFATSTHQTAFWSSVSATPIVMSSVAVGGVSQVSTHNGAVDMNASGHIACNFKNTSGETEACFWNTSTTTGTALAPISGGIRDAAQAIGNNDTLLVNSETASGSLHQSHVLAGGTAVTDDGTLSGGVNSAGTALSPDGHTAAGISETIGETVDADSEAL